MIGKMKDIWVWGYQKLEAKTEKLKKFGHLLLFSMKFYCLYRTQGEGGLKIPIFAERLFWMSPSLLRGKWGEWELGVDPIFRFIYSYKYIKVAE